MGFGETQKKKNLLETPVSCRLIIFHFGSYDKMLNVFSFTPVQSDAQKLSDASGCCDHSARNQIVCRHAIYIDCVSKVYAQFLSIAFGVKSHTCVSYILLLMGEVLLLVKICHWLDGILICLCWKDWILLTDTFIFQLRFFLNFIYHLSLFYLLWPPHLLFPPSGFFFFSFLTFSFLPTSSSHSSSFLLYSLLFFPLLFIFPHFPFAPFFTSPFYLLPYFFFTSSLSFHSPSCLFSPFKTTTSSNPKNADSLFGHSLNHFLFGPSQFQSFVNLNALLIHRVFIYCAFYTYNSCSSLVSRYSLYVPQFCCSPA